MGKQYTIHEVADLLGITPDAIRLYEKEGLVIPFRDEANHYRYYKLEQIHRIMGIMLYRKLDFSIPAIREVFQADSLASVSQSFSKMITETEDKIQELQIRLKKMTYLKEHFQALHESIGHFQIQELPACSLLFCNQQGVPVFDEMKKLLNTPIFSFGHFSYEVSLDDTNLPIDRKLFFVVDDSLLELTPWQEECSLFPHRDSLRCLYTVSTSVVPGDFTIPSSELYAYAESQNLTLASTVYANYLYTLEDDTAIHDFYEIYVPILD